MAGFVQLRAPDSNGDPTSRGSGWYIGDGLILTAGHVVYQFNEEDVPADRELVHLTPAETIAPGFERYEIQAFQLRDAQGRDYYDYLTHLISTLPNPLINTPVGPHLENRGDVQERDRVFVQGNGRVDDGDQGVVTFLDTADAFLPDMGLATTGDTIRLSRQGGSSSNNDGSIVTHTMGFQYTGPAQGGDSGSAVLMHFDSKRFIFGSIVSVFDPTPPVRGPAQGILFTSANFQSLMAHLETAQSGDVTRNEPTNLIVGSNNGDTATGSYRPDIILGRDGVDTISDGDQIGDTVWADDQLFGGRGDDRFTAGAGNDLIHGGDHRVYPGSTTRLGIEDDGEDSISYAAETHGITVRLVPTAQGDQTHRRTTDFARSVFIQTARDTNQDTAISIEKIAGTNHLDTIYISSLTADQVAGSDNKGGLLEVDLAASPEGRANGDLIDATPMLAAIKVDLTAQRIELKDNSAIGFRVLNAERINGGAGNDELTGNDQENVIRGGGGEDKIKGGGGNDLLEGGDARDEIDGDAGQDELRGEMGDDTLRGGAEADRLDGGIGNDTLIGGAGLDVFTGGADNDTLDGGTGDDDQAEVLDGGTGDDTYIGGRGDTIVDLDPGDAVFVVPDGGQSSPAAVPGGGEGFAAAAATGGTPKRLTGGEREKPPEDPCAIQPEEEEEDESSTFESSDGVVYQYDKDSGNLSVSANGVSITITGYENGEGGIRLRETRPNQEQAECQRDPLIIDLNGDREVVEELYDSQAYFDLDNDGFAEHVAWALPEDGLLALDGNGDGLITSGAELFGTGRTVSRGSRTAQEGTDGFAELAKLDSNKDGMIDAADARFGELRVWQDANGDALTDEGELKTLAELGLVSISLAKTESDDIDCGCDGTEIVSMSRVIRADGSVTRAYDAFLSIDQYDSFELNPVPVSDSAAALPQLLGSGTLSDLRVAMSRDPVLLEMVETFAALGPEDAGAIFASVENILLRWTGADAVAADSRGPNINARWVAAIEAITGSSFVQAAIGANPRQDAASILAGEWQEWVGETAAKLLGQTDIGAALMPGLSYAAGAFFVRENEVALDDVLTAIADRSSGGARRRRGLLACHAQRAGPLRRRVRHDGRANRCARRRAPDRTGFPVRGGRPARCDCRRRSIGRASRPIRLGRQRRGRSAGRPGRSRQGEWRQRRRPLRARQRARERPDRRR